jgi:hypothetical protein
MAQGSGREHVLNRITGRVTRLMVDGCCPSRSSHRTCRLPLLGLTLLDSISHHLCLPLSHHPSPHRPSSVPILLPSRFIYQYICGFTHLLKPTTHTTQVPPPKTCLSPRSSSHRPPLRPQHAYLLSSARCCITRFASSLFTSRGSFPRRVINLKSTRLPNPHSLLPAGQSSTQPTICSLVLHIQSPSLHTQPAAPSI